MRDLGLGRFLNITSKAQVTTDLINVPNFCVSKDTIRRKKTSRGMGGNISKAYVGEGSDI